MNDDIKSEIRQQVRAMIIQAFMRGADPSALRDDISLERSHVVDSVQTLELILFIEEQFGFSVENEDAVPENFDNVNSLVDYVARKRAEAA